MTQKSKKQVFERWVPCQRILDVMYLHDVRIDAEAIQVTLETKEPGLGKAILRFEHSLCYRMIDEGDYLLTMNGFQGGWSFFIVKHSSFRAWFDEESCGARVGEDMVHYAIYTPNECMDILALRPPEIRWQDSGRE